MSEHNAPALAGVAPPHGGAAARPPRRPRFTAIPSLPPAWLRRALLHPLLWTIGVVLLAAAAPLAWLGALAHAVAARRPARLARLLTFAWIYLAAEVLVMACAALLWLASGCGWALRRPAFVQAHYRLLACVVAALAGAGSRVFGLTLRQDSAVAHPAVDGASPRARPLLVLSRHAGPGDSLLLIRHLLVHARRQPRIVVKHTLQWDPMIDLVFNRLPMVFVDPAAADQRDSVARIGRLAATMSPRDALLIFPEGCKVTPLRRRRAIERLRRAGQADAARRAEQMRHLMPPRTRGLHAALSARPDLEVLVVAHTGLDHLNSAGELWRALPEDKTLDLRWQWMPAGEVPRAPRPLTEWLATQWAAMDAWIGSRRRRAAGPA